jgi:hypothetical protein
MARVAPAPGRRRHPFDGSGLAGLAAPVLIVPAGRLLGFGRILISEPGERPFGRHVVPGRVDSQQPDC